LFNLFFGFDFWREKNYFDKIKAGMEVKKPRESEDEGYIFCLHRPPRSFLH
jgi:hypothetical protein